MQTGAGVTVQLHPGSPWTGWLRHPQPPRRPGWTTLLGTTISERASRLPTTLLHPDQDPRPLHGVVRPRLRRAGSPTRRPVVPSTRARSPSGPARRRRTSGARRRAGGLRARSRRRGCEAGDEDECDRDRLLVRELPARAKRLGQARPGSGEVSPLERIRREMDQREGQVLQVADPVGDVGSRLRATLGCVEVAEPPVRLAQSDEQASEGAFVLLVEELDGPIEQLLGEGRLVEDVRGGGPQPQQPRELTGPKV
jgi:hypothetical protein